MKQIRNVMRMNETQKCIISRLIWLAVCIAAICLMTIWVIDVGDFRKPMLDTGRRPTETSVKVEQTTTKTEEVAPKTEKGIMEIGKACMEAIVVEIERINVEIETLEPAVLSAYAPSANYYYDISYDDKILIAKVVWAEARGECFEGKVAVAAVVLNRYFYGANKGFDIDSISSVIYQKYQFASIADVTMQCLEDVPECMEAVDAACRGWDPTRTLFPEGALFFYAPEKLTQTAAEDREGIKVLPIGNHNFHLDFNKVY